MRFLDLESSSAEALLWVLDSVRSELNASTVEVWLWDERRRGLALTAVLPKEFANLTSSKLVRRGDGLLGKIAEDKVSVIDFQPRSILRQSLTASLSPTQRARSLYFAGYPLLFRNEFIGALACYTESPMARDQQQSWWVLGNSAAIALRAALMLRDAEESAARLKNLLKTTHLFTQATSLLELLQHSVAYMRSDVSCECACAFVDGNDVLLRACSPAKAEACLEHKPFTGIAGHVFRTGEFVNEADLKEDLRLNVAVDSTAESPVSNVLSIPARGRDGAVAVVLQAVNHPDGAFSIADERALRTLADYLVPLIEKLYTTGR